MPRQFYSQRTGSNPKSEGLELHDIKKLFLHVYDSLTDAGYFYQAFGYECADGPIPGAISDVGMEMLLRLRKENMWPIHDTMIAWYDEDDFLDAVEFFYQYVSQPVDGEYHQFNNCGMHWQTFNKAAGQAEYCRRVNEVLDAYVGRFELSPNGDVLRKVAVGFESIFQADVPTDDSNVTDKVNAAVLLYRKHGSSIEDRRRAVRDLVDVLEYLRARVAPSLTEKDEQDLFNIANNFSIRHHNSKQKKNYDAVWLSWMFYVYLATIHAVLRRMGKT